MENDPLLMDEDAREKYLNDFGVGVSIVHRHHETGIAEPVARLSPGIEAAYQEFNDQNGTDLRPIAKGPLSIGEISAVMDARMREIEASTKRRFYWPWR